MCAATISQGRQRTLLLAVYRPDWADTADTEALCDCIDRLVSRYDNVIMAGDFNFPGMQWSTPGLNDEAKRESLLRYLVIEHHLTQLVRQATSYNAILDLVFVSSSINYTAIELLPPIAQSDHDAQLLRFSLPSITNHINLCRIVDYDSLRFKLSNIDWVTFFSGCSNANQFASKFTDLLIMETDICTRYVPAFRRQRLPRHIVHLLRAKKRAWSTCKHTGDRATLKAASKVMRVALRQHRRYNEMRIIYANDRRSFFKYIRYSFGSQTSSINLCINDTALTDQEAVETLLRKLLSNFSTADNRLINNATSSDTPPLRFNCTTAMVASALQQCSNSSCSSDGISFRLLKAIGGCILFPLNIIYQHSLLRVNMQ